MRRKERWGEERQGGRGDGEEGATGRKERRGGESEMTREIGLTIRSFYFN